MIALQVISQDLPAGIVCENTELFCDGNHEYALRKGTRLAYEEFPEDLKAAIDRKIASRPKAARSLDQLGLQCPDARRRQFIRCNLSGLDRTPDLSADMSTINTEYVPCNIRGNCKYEGKLCEGVTVLNGILTIRELKIMALIRKGLYDKEICDVLFIALDTLKTHKKNIQRKLGVERKSAIANSAAVMQII